MTPKKFVLFDEVKFSGRRTKGVPVLAIRQFGDPVLRQETAAIRAADISGHDIQQLIGEMRNLLLGKKLGIGLAAPQVGIGKSLAIVSIRPTKYRPKAEALDLVIINPKIVETFGYRKQQYEGCISGGPGKASLFAKVPRHKKLILDYYDERKSLQRYI